MGRKGDAMPSTVAAVPVAFASTRLPARTGICFFPVDNPGLHQVAEVRPQLEGVQHGYLLAPVFACPAVVEVKKCLP